jgi:hypothetical protein
MKLTIQFSPIDIDITAEDVATYLDTDTPTDADISKALDEAIDAALDQHGPASRYHHGGERITAAVRRHLDAERQE